MNQGAPEALDPKGHEYEFGPADNQVFHVLAGRMRRVGVVQIILSILQVGGYTAGFILMQKDAGALQLAVEIPIALAFLVSGILLFAAAAPFRAIVDSWGNDIGHLMKAFDKVSALMTVLIGGFGLASVLYLVVFIVKLVKK